MPTTNSIEEEKKPKKDTYEQWLINNNSTLSSLYQKQLDSLESYKTSYTDQINQYKNESIYNAQQNNNKAVLDAQNSYSSNLANYGKNAQTLSSMGLAGSGYSDYLNAQAYAQKRAEMSNANNNMNSAIRDAENKANDSLLSFEQYYNREKLGYDIDYATNLAKLNNDQFNAYTDYKNEINASGYGYDQSELGSGLKYGQISQEMYDDLKNHYKTTTTNSLLSSLDNATPEQLQTTITNVEQLYSNGKLDKEGYQSFYNKYVDNAISGISNGVDIFDVQKEIEKYYNDGKLSQEQYNEKVSKLNNKMPTFNVTVKHNQNDLISYNGKTYKFNYEIIDEKKSSALSKRVGDSVKDGTIVCLGNEAFVYTKNSAGRFLWVKIKDRNNKVSDLIKAFNNK